MLNLKLTRAVISSKARNLLDSSTYVILFLPTIWRKQHFAAIWWFKRFLATLEMTTLWLFC